MTCDSATQPNSGTDYIVTNLHPNYEARIPIKDVQAVYNHKAEIPLEAYRDACLDIRRGWNTLVTPEDVQEASDAWDARGVLHDIDTQWGMLPQGGAYKESNHYWGPGEYDFY